MKIQRIISQHRRDFRAVYECEFCGYTYQDSGYDDAYFHNVVVPQKQCPECGAMAPDDYRPLETKYPNEVTI